MVPKAFQAGYPNTSGFRKVVKATILVKKKEGMSDEDFVEHYNNVHAARAVPILQRHGIISYSIVMRPYPNCYLTCTCLIVRISTIVGQRTRHNDWIVVFVCCVCKCCIFGLACDSG